MTRSTSPNPPCKAVRLWLKGHLGKDCLAPLTGGTSRLFSAYCHLLEAWMASQSREVERALKIIVGELQPSEWILAVWAIPAVGDWGHVEELWPRIKPTEAYEYVGDGLEGKVVQV